MAIEDLDLEFEDETEKGGSDALDVDVDLSFSASTDGNGVAKGAASNRTPKPELTIDKEEAPKKTSRANVANINEAKARAKQTQASVQNRKVKEVASESSGEVAKLRAEIEALKHQVKHQIQNTQQEADMKLAVARAEMDYIVEFVSNAKVMDHQVTQILARINKKAPALNSEVQAIKKYVNELLRKSVAKKKDKAN